MFVIVAQAKRAMRVLLLCHWQMAMQSDSKYEMSFTQSTHDFKGWVFKDLKIDSIMSMDCLAVLVYVAIPLACNLDTMKNQ